MSRRSSNVRLHWLGTAGFQLEYGDSVLLIDPHLTRPQPAGRSLLNSDGVARADAVLITHGHFDHAMDAPWIASVSSAVFLAPQVVCRRLAAFGVPSHRLRPNEQAGTWTTGDGNVEVSVLPSRHIRFDGLLIAMTLVNVLRRRMFWEALGISMSWPLGSNSDFLIRCGESRIYHAGSLGADPKTRRDLEPDLALLPCAGRSNMIPPLAGMVQALKAHRVILHHHDLFWPGFVLPQPAGLVAQKVTDAVGGGPVSVARSGVLINV